MLHQLQEPEDSQCIFCCLSYEALSILSVSQKTKAMQRFFFSFLVHFRIMNGEKKKPLAKGWEAENPQFHDIQKSLKQAVYTSEVVSERTLPVKILECIHNYDQERSVSQRSFSDLSHACIKNYKTQTHHFQLSHMVILFWYPCNF